MSFANPAALWGLLALAIPILIHLFNANRGRRLSFGDTRFIDEAQTQEMRNLFPTQWLLLALRCLLIAALVTWLARPQPAQGVVFRSGVAVLISPLALSLAGESARVTAREIARQNGADLRLLAKGFPRVSDQTDPPALVGGAWSLLAELEDALPPEQRVVMLVADDPRESGWRRPALQRPVQAVDIVTPDAADFGSIRVAIHAAPDRQADAIYLAAALDALTADGAKLTRVPGQEAADIAIRLGDAAGGLEAPLQVRDAVAVGSGPTLAWDWGQRRFDIDLGESPISIDEPLITSIDGRAIAGFSRQEDRVVVTFLSRFHPHHASIVDQGGFPAFLVDLLARLEPRITQPQALVPPRESDPGDRWGAPLWAILIALLWMAERWLATRRTDDVHQPA